MLNVSNRRQWLALTGAAVVKKIASIEQAFGLDDLGALTAPQPPKAG